MRYHLVGLALATFLLVPILVACGQEVSQGEKVATGPCVSCHSKLIVCSNLDQDRDYWKNTVQRMVDKGMDISGQEQQEVVDYLNDQEPGSGPVCD